jgi:hypothetical protein
MKLLISIVLLLSFGQVIGQKNKAIEVVEFNQSTCDQTLDPYRLKSRIVSLSRKLDTLQIEIAFAATCCLAYLPKIKYQSDTLYFSYEAKNEDEACFCICCYSFSHKVKGITSKNVTVKLFHKVIELSNEKYNTVFPTYIIVHGDTVNAKDKFGLKQGIWLTKNSLNNSFIKYLNDKIQTWGQLYENGKIQDEYDTNSKIYRAFYRNGQLKKECYKNMDGSFRDCKQWSEAGQVK